MIRSLFFREKMIVDIVVYPDGTTDDSVIWVKKNRNELYRTGYVKAIDFLHEIEHLFTECYIRFHGFQSFNIGKWNKEHPEQLLPTDTSFTLNDFFKSNTEKKFRKGLSKAAILNGLDSKWIGIIAIVIVGAALAFFVMNGGMF